MRILLLNDHYSPRAPTSVGSIVQNLEHTFRSVGHDVHVLTAHRVEESPEIRRQGHVTSLPISYRKSLRHYWVLRKTFVSRMIEDEMQKLKPDVVHAHNVHTYITYDALRIARKYTEKVFLTTHDVMSFNYGRLMTKRYLASGGQDVRTSFIDHIEQAGMQYNPLRNLRIRSVLSENVTAIVAVSSALKKALDAHCIPRTRVIHNGIDLSIWKENPQHTEEFRSKHGLAGRKIILFGGRLSRDKGAIPLIRALRCIATEIPEALLLVVGDSETWRGLVKEAQVPEHLSAHWRSVGWLSHNDLCAAYAASDVVTTPSLCLDTFNLMNAEAMAMSKPVVGTCFGGTPEVVEDGKTGFIVNPLQEDIFTQALLKLLRDEALAKNMGRAGRQRVEQRFTVERQAKDYLALYGS